MPKGFQKGRKKTGGKIKGTVNKDKQQLIDRIKEKFPNYCPVEAMCKIAQDQENEVSVRLTASKEVAQYIYPKLKSVEHSGNVEQTVIQIQQYKASDANNNSTV